MASKRIQEGSEGYDDILAAWIENGRPSQFDRQGDWGGAIYRVIDTDADTPDFYQAVSETATTTGDKGQVTHEGWHLINKDHMAHEVRTRFRHSPMDYGLEIKIKRASPPNVL